MNKNIKLYLMIFCVAILNTSTVFARVTCSTYNDKQQWCSQQVGCYYDKKDCGCKEVRTITPNCGSFCCATGFTGGGTTLTQVGGYYIYTCGAINVNPIAAAPSTSVDAPSGACQANFTMDNWQASPGADSTKKSYTYRCNVASGGSVQK